MKTEIGIIPDDWKLRQLSEISSMKGRIGWQGLKQNEFTMNHDEPFLITGMNFKDGEILWDEVYHVSVERYQVAKDIQLKPNDILMTKDGTIGKLLYVDTIPHPKKATLNSHLLVFRPIRKSYIPKFLYYNFASKIFNDFIELNKSGSTFFGISQEAISNYLVLLPPTLEEQRAIATALSDTDELISSLDKLITKKLNIKQATMQQLLTGKKRLPGFSGEWEEKTFYEIFRKHSSKDYQIQSADYNVSGKIPVVDQGKKIVVAYTNNENKNFICPSKGIIVFGDHTRIIKYINFDFAVGADGTQLLSTLSNFSTQYFYYLLLIKEIPNTGYNRHFKFILEMTFSIPTFNEQKAIAQVLSEMDSEIEALEQKRNKYKAIKQGMMQQLLTGKKRLVKPAINK